MKAIILAGGAGLRLCETVKDVPKPLAQVAGRPFLEYLIFQLVKWKIKELVLSIGYKGDSVKLHFGDGARWGVQMIYSEEDEPLGTGGALREAIKSMDDEQFVVMNGDSFLDLNFDELILYHNNQQAIATIGLAYVNDISRYGKVEINDKGEITNFVEKNDSGEGIINGGIYLLNREMIRSIPPGKVSLEKDVLPSFVNRRLYGMISKGFFIDIGLPQDYLSICKDPRKLFFAIGL